MISHFPNEKKEVRQGLELLLKHNTLSKHPLPNGTFYPTGVCFDYWNAYLYGNELKIVYFKKGIIHKKPDYYKNFLDDCGVKTAKKEVSEKSDSDEKEKKRFASSLSRSRSAVFELAACNEFSLFCTFTLDKNKYDRYNLEKFRKDLGQFIRNQNRGREDKIQYLSIPERHKDGAWHIHSLIKGLSPEELTPFKLSNKIPERIKKSIRSGVPVYNWSAIQSRFGWFTATEIKDRQATAKYITKYITKDLQSDISDVSRHLYFASQGLKRRECVALHSFEAPPVSKWDFENDYVLISTLKLPSRDDARKR